MIHMLFHGEPVSSLSGRGRLQDVVAYKRFQNSDLTWKLLVCWKTGR